MATLGTKDQKKLVFIKIDGRAGEMGWYNVPPESGPVAPTLPRIVIMKRISYFAF
jgi:hypothetical protein